VPEPINDIGNWVFDECDELLAILNIDVDDYDEDISEEVIERALQQHANLPFHQACSNTSITPQGIVACFHDHGIERATEVDDEQQMTALHVLCANPDVTGDTIRAYLQLAPEVAAQEDFEEMTPFQYLCRNDISFIDDRSFSSVMAWWYGSMPPQTETTGKKRKR